jgi:hypothetical protein
MLEWRATGRDAKVLQTGLSDEQRTIAGFVDQAMLTSEDAGQRAAIKTSDSRGAG